MLDFEFTETQEEFRAQLRELALRELLPHYQEDDASQRYPREQIVSVIRFANEFWKGRDDERDLIGEASLLAFTYAQTRNRGLGFIVVVAYLKAGRELPEARRLIREGYRRGQAAAWLPGQDWEALLEQPLEDVRAQLRVGAPPVYEQVRSDGAPALASERAA